jgi:hypothetical protein
MGTVRGWGSPGLPSLNRTLDFEMNEDDFKWICKFKLLLIRDILQSLIVIIVSG